MDGVIANGERPDIGTVNVKTWRNNLAYAALIVDHSADDDLTDTGISYAIGQL